MEASSAAVFVHVNEKFVAFHKGLGVTIIPDKICGTNLEDYFRLYLGFTEEQIQSRLSSLQQSVKTLVPHPFKEISEHPGVPVLVLDSVWRPVKTDDGVYVIWESRIYHRSKTPA